MASSKESEDASQPGGEHSNLLSIQQTDALRKLVHQRLRECGWRDDIQKMVRSILKQRGVYNVSYEDITAEVIPKARELVPEELLKEVEMRVRDILEPAREDD
ncbi:enhancer of yellow 2b transcription factor-like isoform X1 [Drosophila novamexicana]|uniref:enhancer of yellow 2b transcription factor-like isoform X1 n=1 Tax=Drosophila novamexicana TaxID=47314 RepID=UPI0011E5FE13|nr:enhancer of yellow 2b transcription factor-like isoform X1 [Drosophila novamexicana]XP_030566100.1 enhancer of yellow 2b transcription factor-like isoform X1 [Drosophila novamexicana]